MRSEEKDIRNAVRVACREARIRSGITQAEFARRYNLDALDVSNFENCNVFMLLIFYAYHNAYGIMLEDFAE